MSNVKLKPCPFCGCDTIVIYHDSDESVGFRAGYYISHPLWKTFPETWNCNVTYNGYFDTEEEAAERWNGRCNEKRISEDTKTIARELIEAVDSLPWLPEDVRDTVSRFELAMDKEKGAPVTSTGDA